MKPLNLDATSAYIREVNVVPNPRYSIFLAELRKIRRPFSKWADVLFRATPLPYAQAAKLLNGMGSLSQGGRWSAAGTFPAVNTSTAAATAYAESGASFTYYNFAPSDVRPKLVVVARARLHKVIDLVRGRGLRSKPWVELDKLLAEDWHKVNNSNHESLSQAFGRAAHDLGAEGLLVPSVRVPGGVNLVYFPQSLVAKSRVEILGEADLDRWIKKR
jgi:RES domain-containing protein